MKRAAYITLLILFSLAVAACTATDADEPAGPVAIEFITDLGGIEVTVGVENEYPPFNILNADTGVGEGWDYDVFRALCEKLNCVPIFTEIAWPPFEMMGAGELDVVGDGITLKMGRAMIVDFSDPYIEYGMVMMMRTDNVYETPEDFAASDARVASQAGTTNEASALELVGEGRVDNYGEWPIAIEALVAGDADGVAIDAVAAAPYIQEHAGKLMSGFALTSGELLAFVFPPGSPLLGPFNYALQEMLNDGSLDVICQEWLFTNCTPDE